MNIKSQKAKHKLGDLSFVLHATVSEVDVHKLCDNIEEIVSAAEQDAEERAIKTAKKWFVKLFPAITNQATIDIMADDFIELYKNGGHSDEND